MGLIDDIATRQVELDTKIAQNISVDINFMELEDFKEYLQKIEGIEYELKEQKDIEQERE